MDISREYIVNWLDKGLQLQTEDAIYIPCASREHQDFLSKAFNKELLLLNKINPNTRLSVKKTARVDTEQGTKHIYIQLKMGSTDSAIGWMKSATGKVKRIVLEDKAAERVRRQMKEEN